MITVTYVQIKNNRAVVRVSDGEQQWEVDVMPANKNDLDGSGQPRRDPESIDPLVIAAHDANIVAYEATVDLESFEEAAARWARDAFGVALSAPPKTFEQLVAEATSFDDLKALMIANARP